MNVPSLERKEGKPPLPEDLILKTRVFSLDIIYWAHEYCTIDFPE